MNQRGLTREKLRALPKSHVVAFVNCYNGIVLKLEPGGTSDDILKILANGAKENVVRKQSHLRWGKKLHNYASLLANLFVKMNRCKIISWVVGNQL